LAAAPEVEWGGRVVLHHAGALGLDPLRPLARAGAFVGVLHPLQTLGDASLAASLLVGSHARIEGQPRARAAAARLARDVGLVPLPLGRHLSAADRAAYHAAASLVSNDLLALLSHGVQLLESIGLDHRAALRALAPLARGTLVQAERHGIGRTLTGPVVRGDAETVRGQLASLRRRSRSAAEVHRLLSEQLIRLAEQEGHPLPRAELRRLRAVLRAGRRGGPTV
jgi:predicted short-subunit dehydrogenase-like oxidoreductase (DUF2520 family)